MLYSPCIQWILSLNCSMWSRQGTGWGGEGSHRGVHFSAWSLNLRVYGFENDAEGESFPAFSWKAWSCRLPRAVQSGRVTLSSNKGTPTGAGVGLERSTEATNWVMLEKSITKVRSYLYLQPCLENSVGFGGKKREINSFYFPLLLSGWEGVMASRKAPFLCN